MERDLYKQTKLAKTLEFKLKTVSNFKATASFFNFLSFKNKKEKKSCNKSVNFFYYSTQKYDDSITTWFPFSRGQFRKKTECCVYMMHVQFSGSFPDYTIIICKFKIGECFLFMIRFKFTRWRHLNIVRS